MAGVFISYRREESAAWTRRLHDRVGARLGGENVFLDVEAIAPGDDFVRTIEEVLGSVDAVVVVIGPRWLSAAGDGDRPRLEDPSDYVRREIAIALERSVRVVPVLVDGAHMPAASDLPEDIAELSFRNAVAVSDTRFDRDVDHLLEALDLEATPTEAPPHNLPVQATPFIGRAEEIAATKSLLMESRCVSLLGPGGSGKTRLALQVASDFFHRYEDGAWFVDLRKIADAAEVAPLVASTLRVIVTGSHGLVDQLVDALGPRRLLLILDNCEHVLEGVAPLVERLLARSGDVGVIATSRQPLGVPGESTLSVPPLPLPATADLDALLDSASVRLFADRARAASRSFALAAHNDAVFKICTAVEGLPLALELAAARVRSATPEQIASRLGDQLKILKGSRTAGDLRHATVEATIRWSWDLLDAAEQALLERSSLFRESWRLEDAEGVCGFAPLDQDAVFDVLGALVDKSLVTLERDSGRYRMLEPIRQFADRQLSEAATADLRSRSVDHWKRALRDSYGIPMVEQERRQEVGKALIADAPNLIAAIDAALEAGRYEDAMIIVGSVGDLFWLLGSSFDRASRWLDTALRHRSEIDPDVLLWALHPIAFIAAYGFRNDAWLRYAEAGIDVSREDDDRYNFEIGAALATLRLERREEALRRFDRVIAETESQGLKASALIAKAEAEDPRRAWVLVERAMEMSPLNSLVYWYDYVAMVMIAGVAFQVGRYDIAARMLEQSLTISRSRSSVETECLAGARLARIRAAQGRLEDATTLVEEVVPIVRRVLGAGPIEAIVFSAAAESARLQGDLDEARAYLKEWRQASARDDMTWWPLVGANLEARLALDEGNVERSQELLNEAVLAAEASGEQMLLSWLRVTRAVAAIREGEPTVAIDQIRRVLATPASLAHLVTVEAVDVAAIASCQHGEVAPAARLIGAVDAERQRTGLVCPPPDLPLREAAVERARAELGDDWDVEVNAGRNLTLDEAVEYTSEVLVTV